MCTDLAISFDWCIFHLISRISILNEVILLLKMYYIMYSSLTGEMPEG